MDPFIQVELSQEKETKNMIKFSVPGDVHHSANVPDLYVRKTTLANAFGKFPTKIKITIEEAK